MGVWLEPGKGELQRGDILVIDEAGLAGSRQLARIASEVEARGAKLVLVGDHEQLPAIGAGSPFRAIAERIGSVELTDIRRQQQDWQRQASVALATHRTGDGLNDYADRGHVVFADNRAKVCRELMRDYLTDRKNNPGASRIALAQRHVDVRAINDGIRAALQAEGLLAKGDLQMNQGGASGICDSIGNGQGDADPVFTEPGASDADPDRQTDREIVYRTITCKQCFASGDCIVLLENNRKLGVKMACWEPWRSSSQTHYKYGSTNQGVGVGIPVFSLYLSMINKVLIMATPPPFTRHKAPLSTDPSSWLQ
jgi:ATP-dependent exoDNAse (exonuclease V) alpha subunit